MGHAFLDPYSLLHFAVGVVAYFWGVSLEAWIGVHILFEVLENTRAGMAFINTMFLGWPGGKPRPDSVLNSVGDTVCAAGGWLAAQALDRRYGAPSASVP